MQYDVLSRYKEVIVARRKDLDLYKQMVEDYKKTNNANIDVITMHTGEDKKFDSKKGVYSEEEKFLPDTHTYANIVRNGDKRNDDEVKQLINSLDNTDGYPKGIIVCLLNKNEKIQHVISYVVGLDQEGKRVIIHNDSAEFYLDHYGVYGKPNHLDMEIKSSGMFKLAALLASNSLDIKDDINENSKKEYFKEIDKAITSKHEQYLKDFKEIKMQRRLDQTDIVMCMQLSLIFCTQLLKKNELGITEFDKLTNSEDKKPKLPLSIMKYDNLYTPLHLNDDLLEEYNIDENNTELKEIKQAIVGSSNTLAPKEVLDWFYKHCPLNNFVDNNVAIQPNNITSENIIKYLTDECNYRNRGNKITRNVGLNRRRKARFNALCEILEGKISQQTGKAFSFGDDFSNFKDKKDAIEQINKLFVEDNNVYIINNGVPQQNLNTINQLKQEIANRLNQVGCCSCC